MSESSPWIADDEPLSAATQSRLPRFQIVHMLMWTAAIAIAFGVNHLILKWLEPPPDLKVTPGPLITGFAVAYRLCEGTLLFVALAAVMWRLRGLARRLEPGQLMAGIGATLAVMEALVALMSFSGFRFRTLSWLLIVVPPWAFSVWLVVLAAVGREPRAWRRAYAVVAATFLVGSGLKLLSIFQVRPIVTIAVAALQALVVFGALISDLRTKAQRHWSHWLGGLAFVATRTEMALALLWGWFSF
jgi:hypothetical protein